MWTLSHDVNHTVGVQPGLPYSAEGRLSPLLQELRGRGNCSRRGRPEILQQCNSMNAADVDGFNDHADVRMQLTALCYCCMHVHHYAWWEAHAL